MYPIAIVTNAQPVHYSREVNLGDAPITIATLQEHVTTKETLTLNDRDGDTILYVYGKRLETVKEVEARVAKAEKYMHNYNRFHGFT